MHVISRKTPLLVAALLAALPVSPSAQVRAGYGRVLPSLALVGYPTGDPRLPIAFGSGFAVMSKSSPPRTYFVTNAHVVSDALGKPAGGLFVVLPREPEVRRAATIVRRNADLDIAIVSAEIGDVPTVRVSRQVPDAGNDVAIAGFPYAEVCGLAAMCGAARAVPNGHKGKLKPALSRGPVSESQLGEYSIVYHAVVQQGNSGGPLFDPDSGVVYGIVVDALPNYGDANLPAQTEVNRAISLSVGLPFIDQNPVAVTTAEASRSLASEGGTTRSMTASALSSSPPHIEPYCVARLHFERAYGEWLQAHGLLTSISAAVSAGANGARPATFATAVARVRSRQQETANVMGSALDQLRHESAARLASEIEPLLAAVRASMPQDAALAAALGSPKAIASARAAEANLERTARQPSVRAAFVAGTCPWR